MIKQFLLLITTYACTMGTTIHADSFTKTKKKFNIPTEQLLRVIDTNEEDGRSCESYNFITPQQRFSLLKQNDFMLGDIISSSLRISSVDSKFLVDTNLTTCNVEDYKVSEYIYREELEYLGDNIITIGVFEYSYGAGAAHGSGHMSHHLYDREYGMEINWKDLFSDSYAFELYILDRVKKEIASKEFISYFKSKDQLLNFKKEGYFAITDEGLLIQYGKYEITPGCDGLPSLVVPKDILKQYMTQKLYAKCFLTRKQMVLEALNEF